MEIADSKKKVRRFSLNRRPKWLLRPIWIALILGPLLIQLSSSETNFYDDLKFGRETPPNPINLTVLDVTDSSALLRWSFEKMMELPPELSYKVEYKSQWDSNPERWHTIYLNNSCTVPLPQSQIPPFHNLDCRIRETGDYYFNITDLKYPFTQYDFRVYACSSESCLGHKQSAPVNVILKTKPTIPRRPPRTDIGSFSTYKPKKSNFTRDVYIYWQNINENEKCGDSFEYHVYYTSISKDNRTYIHRSNETHFNYAKFSGLNTTVSYNFSVYSANEKGLSAEFSTVYVPSQSEKYEKPFALTKLELKERGVYELTWRKGPSHKLSILYDLNYYTLFWCEISRTRPHYCISYMNWTHIPSSEYCFNVTVPDHTKNYKFGINGVSSLKNGFKGNYQSISRSNGLSWESCSLNPNKTLTKMEHVWISHISTTLVEMTWRLECSYQLGQILQYQITSCPIESVSNNTCMEPVASKNYSGEIVRRVRTMAFVRNLKPFTLHKITISVNTSYGVSKPSDPIYVTTKEGAPNMKDLIVNVTRITSTSVDIEWSPPKYANGIIRYYIIHYYLEDDIQQELDQDLVDLFDDRKFLYKTHNVTVSDTKVCLKNLKSFKDYNFTITACTTICSDRSFPIGVRTAVGFPEKIERPSILQKNSTGVLMSWLAPTSPGGPLDYYQVTVCPRSAQTTGGGISSSSTIVLTQENSKNVLYKTMTNTFLVPIPECNPQDMNKKTFDIAVQAVNNNSLEPDSPYYGPWSIPVSVDCLSPKILP